MSQRAVRQSASDPQYSFIGFLDLQHTHTHTRVSSLGSICALHEHLRKSPGALQVRQYVAVACSVTRRDAIHGRT